MQNDVYTYTNSERNALTRAKLSGVAYHPLFFQNSDFVIIQLSTILVKTGVKINLNLDAINFLV